MIAAFSLIWALTGVGYLARRWRLLSERAGALLGRFVFTVAMPATLLVTLAKVPLADFDVPAISAFAVSTVATIAVGAAISRRAFQRRPGEQALAGMVAGYVNSANLGIPIALQVLGNASFLVEVMLFQLLLVTPVLLAVLDLTCRAKTSISGRLAGFVTLPVRNPVILSSALGVLVSSQGWRIPAVVSLCLTPLGATAVPAALVALGVSLSRQKESPVGPAGEIAAFVALKLVLQPAVAFLIGRWVLHLSATSVLAVVVCAGLPTAQATFIYAQEYGVAEAVARRVILVTSAASMATLAVLAVLLRT